MIKLKLKKLEPFPMEVPCLDGLGSWYDLFVNKWTWYMIRGPSSVANRGRFLKQNSFPQLAKPGPSWVF
jgi:hypothetical protein